MRMGKKKQPTYRIVAADSRSPRDGRFLEIIGTYQPRLEPSGVKVDVPRAVHWLKHGAQPSEAVGKLLRISGAMDVFEGKAPMPEPDGTPTDDDEAGASATSEAPSAESESAEADPVGDAPGSEPEASEEPAGVGSESENDS
jgi:small subunit ribosomal protein S16